ncbi:damage-inducible protein DinB [Adhaeribacter sp. BT258]|uniref:Damage-inducible protein DinB n=1 Tax=Adhaeribacter terrigena TaxID=2793070 RepID=A0ABS1C4G7_9BACT|nr:DinB family protein [Adhaeribacter terrigena]MBK0404076.1 damage-inducible protein DinB [Adhaeribacter terrigena]
MENTLEKTATATFISPADMLAHWQGHRNLTRRVIAAFPEKELFEFSIGGMRTFSAIVQELLALGAPGLRQIAMETNEKLNEDIKEANSKENILRLWDESTAEITQLWSKIPAERFNEKIVAFGQYEGTVWSTILYYIDNEIHHRGQGYVYLRALNIEPPFFWER